MEAFKNLDEYKRSEDLLSQFHRNLKWLADDFFYSVHKYEKGILESLMVGMEVEFFKKIEEVLNKELCVPYPLLEAIIEVMIRNYCTGKDASSDKLYEYLSKRLLNGVFSTEADRKAEEEALNRIQNNPGLCAILGQRWNTNFNGTRYSSKDLEKWLEKGNDINMRLNDTGLTAMHYAVQKNNICMINSLIACKADINIKDTYGATPLRKALSLDKLKIITLLLENGATL